ncbi:MAG: pyridoxamine 5'-phosphate oxidase [Bacteroidia bacterium]|nr:pyridoxamine 5'-phosphate oxidase [Bacteroidota bacterium]MCZ2129840.1 pyridoxamine 5'-phosphate oxidase [Bacteroidia bacterium]
MLDKETLQNLRQNYMQAAFNESDADNNPFVQFDQWFNHALECHILEPNALNIATVDESGHPNLRTVLLKGVDTGFVFYTNYESAKGRELIHTPYAAMSLLWLDIARQIRIRGKVEKVNAAESDEYFHSRPFESQLGAVASKQSQPLQNRQQLESIFEKLHQNHPKEVERPSNWGGFRLIPNHFEFWQGRSNRLHDRICYDLKEGIWVKGRLFP